MSNSNENENTQELDVDDVKIPIKRNDGETLKDRMTDNAYSNILPSRYMRKDERGNLIESQEDVFPRIAKNVALAEVIHFEDDIEASPEHIKSQHSNREDLIDEVFGEGVTENDDVTVTLDGDNIYNFSYDNIYELLDDEQRAQVEEVKDDFLEVMENLNFMPNSPTIMNAGDELQQLSACFVASPADEMEDIHDKIKEASKVFKSGGGMGYGFWELRPRGDKVGSSGGVSSGPLSFMQTYDQMCETVSQGGKRRGAQMAVMRISHPDVLEFIHAKNKDVSLARTLRLNDPDDYTHSKFGEALEEARELITEEGQVPKHLRNAVEGNLSNFNISVGITDDFMDALQNGEEFTFTNPRTGEPFIANQETKEMYGWFGLDDYVEVGEVLSIPAQELWDRIISGAHENGEPGVIYLERSNKDHSFDVEEHPEYQIKATNPCGEQPLSEYEACNLGHINLSTLAEEDATDWRVWSREHSDDYETDREAINAYMQENIRMDELNERIEIGTRFLENVVTMSDFPVDEITERVRNMRKVGLGIMGLAQLYFQIGMQYGSEPANLLASEMMQHIEYTSKDVSHELAKERGSFEAWEKSKYANPTDYPEWFEDHTGRDADEWEDGFPIRNHNTMTVAPTGTTSMIGNTSGGCEPIFNVAYYKNVSEDVQGDEMLVEFDDYFLRTLEANDVDVEAAKKEAAEQMSNNNFNGASGMETVPDAIGEVFIISSELSGKEHASVQCACQDGVDAAISKTCNFPNNATPEDMDEVYRYIYNNGGKGVTVYRDGTRNKQVLTTRAQNTEFAEADEEEVLDAVETNIESDWFRQELAELMMDAGSGEESLTPEEFAEELGLGVVGQGTEISTPRPRDRDKVLYGRTEKISTGYGTVYVTLNEDEEGLFECFTAIGKSGGFLNSFTESLGKLVSLALRSGIPPEEVIDKMEGIRSPKVAWDEGEKIQSIPDAIAMAMKRYLTSDERRRMLELQGVDVTIPESLKGSVEEETSTVESGGGASVEVGSSEAAGANESGADGPNQDILDSGDSPICPECEGMNLYYTEGCKTCEDCGWSEC